jgi:hypothetical protein
MKRILFFAHDPGGANAVKPLIMPLKQKGYDVIIKGDGSALSILPDVEQYTGDTDLLIEKLRPDFVITGTSAADMTEKKLRKSAKKYDVPCMAILDAWVNYNRFTKYSCNELRENGKYNETEYLPDYYIVMDEYAKQEAIKEGIPSEIIYPLGNPHFKSVRDAFDELNTEELRQKLLNGKEKLVVWASECLIEDYGTGMELESLKDVIELMPDNVQLVVKPHPREKVDKFDGFKNIKIVRDITSREAIKSADIVMSMTSMVLIESIIGGKPCISYQIGADNKDKFILTKIGALPFINDKIKLKEEFENILRGKYSHSSFKINFNAAENIIKFMEDKLC